MPSDTVLKDIYAAELARTIVKRKRTATRLRDLRAAWHEERRLAFVLGQVADAGQAFLRERDELRARITELENTLRQLQEA